jgi:hypothetical protein
MSRLERPSEIHSRIIWSIESGIFAATVRLAQLRSASLAAHRLAPRRYATHLLAPPRTASPGRASRRFAPLHWHRHPSPPAHRSAPPRWPRFASHSLAPHRAASLAPPRPAPLRRAPPPILPASKDRRSLVPQNDRQGKSCLTM